MKKHAIPAGTEIDADGRVRNPWASTGSHNKTIGFIQPVGGEFVASFNGAELGRAASSGSLSEPAQPPALAIPRGEPGHRGRLTKTEVHK
jgi:hypothetical protein